jgi:hypothetical protein
VRDRAGGQAPSALRPDTEEVERGTVKRGDAEAPEYNQRIDRLLEERRRGVSAVAKGKSMQKEKKKPKQKKK